MEPKAQLEKDPNGLQAPAHGEGSLISIMITSSSIWQAYPACTSERTFDSCTVCTEL